MVGLSREEGGTGETERERQRQRRVRRMLREHLRKVPGRWAGLPGD